MSAVSGAPRPIDLLVEAIDSLMSRAAGGASADGCIEEFTDDELHAFVVTLQRQRARLGAVAAEAIARWDDRGVWSGDGSRSAAARLSRDTNTSSSSAKVELRRARALRTMPATRSAVADGRLSIDHVDLLARANQTWRDAVFADHEALLVEQCERLRFHDARRMVEYWCQRADADRAEEDAEHRRRASHLHCSETIDGERVISGRLDPIGGSIVDAELARLERELYLADRRDGVVRTASQRRAAALVEMATRSASAPANARRPKPLFTVLIGDHTLTRLCELADGTVLPPGQLGAWLGVADLETVLFDGPSSIVSVSHRRTFTGALRRAIEVRDRRCQHPSGCDVPAHRCDVDHIVPRARNGETSQFNGRLECPTHNRRADRHDHDATPLPTRPVTRLDELRARLRWRMQHHLDDGDSCDGDAGDTGGDGLPGARRAS
jgi:hypothetical protein